MVTVSVCMIVKNEEPVLRRCLDSLKGLWDELIIVDTGSTDATKAIASDYTDKIYDFEWVDDFSKARNFAFSKCTQDYIYSVDADEVLDEINREKFISLKNSLLPEIEIVQMVYVNTSEFATTESYSKELRAKLYKRLREFTWIDPVHETVNLNPVVYDSDIEILHMPISNHAGRDFKVFQKTINSGTALSPKLIKMYSRELLIAGNKEDLDEAKDYFFFAVNDVQASQDTRDYATAVLTKAYRLLEDDVQFFKWAMKDICVKQSSEVCFELGCFYFDRQDYNEAINWFINAATETTPILNACITKDAYLKLSDCYKALASEDEMMNDIYLDEAEKYISMANSIE